MNTDDYLFTYFVILDKTASMIPTYDQVVVHELVKNNQRFTTVTKKYDQATVDQTIHEIFVQLINGRIFQGNIAKDEIIISNTTPLAVEILQHVQDQSFWSALKQTADQWSQTPLTKFVVDYVEH
ncbi:hypothetical protein [Limosilactobacillus sp.]|uniref:hypothetical protein n=1 Tax=Limosilactobacillus sp. TaxID=2773925 RepID=UPI003F0F5A55